MEIANRETYGLLAVVLLLLIRQYPVDLAIQNFVLRRRLRLRFLQSLQMLYLFYKTRRLQVARRPRRAWVFPRPQNCFQELLNNRALDHWWKENFRVTRATFEFICRLAVISAQHLKNVPSMCCGFRIYYFLPADWLNYSCG